MKEIIKYNKMKKKIEQRTWKWSAGEEQGENRRGNGKGEGEGRLDKNGGDQEKQ